MRMTSCWPSTKATTRRLANVACSFLVILLRMAWLFPGARVSYFIRRRILHQTDTRPTARELVIIGWSGLRGVVTLAAAMSLPTFLSNGANFPQRDLVVFLAFSVVVFTLVFQGLTLAPLIRALGLAGASGPDCEERDAHRIAVEAALKHLEEARQHDRAEYAGVYDDLRQHYRDQLNAIFCAPDDAAAAPPPHYRKHRTVSNELLGVQRRTLLQLRRQGRINDQVLRNLERDLDLQEARDS